MRHVSCDSCKRNLSEGGSPHYSVKMEASKVHGDTMLTDDDFGDYTDGDSVHEMELMMQGACEDTKLSETPAVRLVCKEFDFCEECYAKFSADPLGLKRAGRRRFSTN